MYLHIWDRVHKSVVEYVCIDDNILGISRYRYKLTSHIHIRIRTYVGMMMITMGSCDVFSSYESTSMVTDNVHFESCCLWRKSTQLLFYMQMVSFLSIHLVGRHFSWTDCFIFICSLFYLVGWDLCQCWSDINTYIYIYIRDNSSDAFIWHLYCAGMVKNKNMVLKF